MNIFLYSKTDIAGGSERRLCELANGIKEFTSHSVYIGTSSGHFPDALKKVLNEDIPVYTEALKAPELFYEADVLIIINSDSRCYSQEDYWAAKLPSNLHNPIDLSKMSGKKVLHIFNFIISPAQNLHFWEKYGVKAAIISTNQKFNKELNGDKFSQVKALPRFILQSPIDPRRIKLNNRVGTSEDTTFVSLSKKVGSKWCDDIPKLVDILTSKYNDKVKFKFMGIKEDLKPKLSQFTNCECFDENAMSVSDLLQQGDVFLFMPQWNREEPLARSISEGIMAGLPVVALDKGGTPDIVSNNGLLFKNFDECLSKCMYLIEHKDIMKKMGNLSRIYSQEFSTQSVIHKLIKIIEAI